MTNKEKEELFKNLNELQSILESPTLYLANYFSELRSQVDTEIVSKLVNLKKEDKEDTNLVETWQKMITKINSFEKECIKKRYQLKTFEEAINSIESILNDMRSYNFDEIKELIQYEEHRLLERLFQSKTIVFLSIEDLFETSKFKWTDCKTHKLLIVLDNEFISLKAFKEK